MNYDTREQFRRLSVWRDGKSSDTLASDSDREFISDLINTAYQNGYISQDGMEKRLEQALAVPAKVSVLAHCVNDFPIHRNDFHGTGGNLSTTTLAIPKAPIAGVTWKWRVHTFFMILLLLGWILSLLGVIK